MLQCRVPKICEWPRHIDIKKVFQKHFPLQKVEIKRSHADAATIVTIHGVFYPPVSIYRDDRVDLI